MPYTFLSIKPGRELEHLGSLLAAYLPDIIAPALTLCGHAIHEGGVSPNEIMVFPSSTPSMNGKDLEVLILAHNFPARLENIEERKEQVLDGIRLFLADNLRNDITGAVCIVLAPMAYGEL